MTTLPASDNFEFDYGSVATFYDHLASIYSRGRIGLTKRTHLAYVKPHMRVAYPGVGSGCEAIEAARLGACVVGLDVSTKMLGRFRLGLSEADLQADLLRCDVARHEPRQAYDMVVANYFLNLFDAPRTRAMFQHLSSWLAPGGLIVVSDFAAPTGGGAGRLVDEAYYRPVNWIAWALGLCALHPVTNVRELVESSGFRIVEEARLPVFRFGHPGFVCVVAEKNSHG